MDSTFDAAEFVKDIGVLLVHAYDGARKATTPGLVGSAIEQPVRKLLSSVLPRGLSVGTGCVVDSYGKTSRQMDVVLYERDICPVFRVNDTPEATYFPCEGVVAVGEIKAAIDGPKLEDSFDKIASVKVLRRHREEIQPTVRRGKEIPELRYCGQRCRNSIRERKRRARTRRGIRVRARRHVKVEAREPRSKVREPGEKERGGVMVGTC